MADRRSTAPHRSRGVIPILSSNALPDLSGRRVLVPGGTGAVGEGVVRGYLAAGADVVVPTRTRERLAEFRRVLGDAATARLHVVVHDYTSFAAAERLAEQMEHCLGGVDDVAAPIGGWWAGKRLWEIGEATGRSPSSTSRPRAWPSGGPSCPGWRPAAPTP